MSAARSAAGCTWSSALPSYLDMLLGAEPEGGFAEVRLKLPRGGMRQLFVRVRDSKRLVSVIQGRGAGTDLYVGVCPRARQTGGRDAIDRCHVLWADCDDESAIAALEEFEPKPSMVISSGSGRHGYWSLSPPISPDEAEEANRRLAHALGADMQATDAARILRPPGTSNWKTGKPVPVTVERLQFDVYTVEQVVGELPYPPNGRVSKPANDSVANVQVLLRRSATTRSSPSRRPSTSRPSLAERSDAIGSCPAPSTRTGTHLSTSMTSPSADGRATAATARAASSTSAATYTASNPAAAAIGRYASALSTTSRRWRHDAEPGHR